MRFNLHLKDKDCERFAEPSGILSALSSQMLSGGLTVEQEAGLD